MQASVPAQGLERERVPEQEQERVPEQEQERVPEQEQERVPEQEQERVPEQEQERAPELGRERGPEQSHCHRGRKSFLSCVLSIRRARPADLRLCTRGDPARSARMRKTRLRLAEGRQSPVARGFSLYRSTLFRSPSFRSPSCSCRLVWRPTTPRESYSRRGRRRPPRPESLWLSPGPPPGFSAPASQHRLSPVRMRCLGCRPPEGSRTPGVLACLAPWSQRRRAATTGTLWSPSRSPPPQRGKTAGNPNGMTGPCAGVVIGLTARPVVAASAVHLARRLMSLAVRRLRLRPGPVPPRRLQLEAQRKHRARRSCLHRSSSSEDSPHS